MVQFLDDREVKAIRKDPSDPLWPWGSRQRILWLRQTHFPIQLGSGSLEGSKVDNRKSWLVVAVLQPDFRVDLLLSKCLEATLNGLLEGGERMKIAAMGPAVPVISTQKHG